MKERSHWQVLQLKKTLRPSSISIVNIFSLYTLYTQPKKNVDFQIQWKLHFVGGQFLKFWSLWSFINLPWGHVIFNTKFGPDRFSRFFWIQTERQAKYIYSCYWYLNYRLWVRFASISAIFFFTLKYFHFIHFQSLLVDFQNVSALKNLKCGFL